MAARTGTRTLALAAALAVVVVGCSRQPQATRRRHPPRNPSPPRQQALCGAPMRRRPTVFSGSR